MKKFNYLLLLSVIAGTSFTITGCDEDDLNIEQKGVTNLEEFYKTDNDAISALTTIYSDTHNNFAFIPELTGYNYSPYFALTNFLGDDIFLSGSGVGDAVPERQYHDFRMATNNVVVEGGYTMLYRSIHKCNLLINNLEALPSRTETMDKCIAEARVMRAFDHLLLGIYWGAAPVVENVLDNYSEPANDKSQAEIMTWVASEIDKALPLLDERESTSDYEGAVKITTGFALAIKGKALLWKGDYSGAKEALGKVISSNKYALLPSNEISKILHADGKGSCESVFEFNVQADGTNVNNIGNRASGNAPYTFNWRYEFFQSFSDGNLNKDGWGWVNPSESFCKALIENDGMESARRKAWIISFEEMITNLEWAADTISRNAEQKLTSDGYGLKKGAVVYGNCGYFDWKNVMHQNQGDNYFFDWCGTWARNFQIMRYAEVLLMYAEACAQLGETTGDGLKALNLIQERAQSKHISTALSLEEVQNEKLFEMWQEGCRGVDLIRWKKLESLKTQDWEIPVLHDAYNEGGSKHEAKVVWEPTSPYKDGGAGFKEGKNEFLPLPQTAVDLNSKLKQNPGW